MGQKHVQGSVDLKQPVDIQFPDMVCTAHAAVVIWWLFPVTLYGSPQTLGVDLDDWFVQTNAAAWCAGDCVSEMLYWVAV
jgi:hypothetical protein